MGHLIPTDFHEDYAEFLTPQECQEISTIILNSEQDILNIDNHENNDYYSGTTKQYNVYNWLIIQTLQNIIYTKEFLICLSLQIVIL